VLRDKASFPAMELIVIDGESTDGTQEMLAQYGADIRWISAKAGGPYGAWAQGLPLATGRYVRVISDDDVYVTGRLPAVVPHLERSAADIVAGRSALAGEDASSWKAFPWKPERYTLNSFLRWPIWQGIKHESVFFSRDLFTRYGAWDTRYAVAADTEIVARFLGKGATFVRLEAVVLLRVNHAEALSVKHAVRGARDVCVIMLRMGKPLHVAMYLAGVLTTAFTTRFMPFLELSTLREKLRGFGRS